MYYLKFNDKYRLTISAGGMQTMRAIIEMQAYRLVLSMSVWDKIEITREVVKYVLFQRKEKMGANP